MLVVAEMGKSFGLGCDPVVGSLTSVKMREYRVTINQCLKGGVIVVLQSYVDEDTRRMRLFTQ
ncbi:polycomb group protein FERTILIZATION-INDEPENDENT ENDOSPERM [Spatholobus suberectus]|nr:polycomb group protein FERTILIZATION-INDEPENDENT ENDOSPERM [Spatholobus suberectus]